MRAEGARNQQVSQLVSGLFRAREHARRGAARAQNSFSNGSALASSRPCAGLARARRSPRARLSSPERGRKQGARVALVGCSAARLTEARPWRECSPPPPLRQTLVEDLCRNFSFARARARLLACLLNRRPADRQTDRRANRQTDGRWGRSIGRRANDRECVTRNERLVLCVSASGELKSSARSK